MPLLTAEKHQWTKQPPYNFYHFPDEHRAGWEVFWEEMDGDLDKILEFAKKAKIESPNEWFESLHRFLFDTFSGNVKLLKVGADTSFGTFLGKVTKVHKDKPKGKQWYTVRGITKNKFIAMLERASDINDVRQAVAFMNARVKDLGFFLYSEFILSKTKGKSELKSVASNLNFQAYELEYRTLGKTLLSSVSAGSKINHCMFPGEVFEVMDVSYEPSIARDKPSMIVASDTAGRIAFITDVWNVRA